LRIIILAAGEGKRLRPYTDKIPKCMVKLAGDHMLSHQLSSIEKCKIIPDDIALVGGYRIEALEKYHLQKFNNPKYSSTNMVATLFCARKFMKQNEDLIISYGDIIYEDNVLRAILDCNEEICVAADKEWERLWRLRMGDPLKDAETFLMDDEFLISELGKKPTSFLQIQAQYIGLIKIRGDMVTELIDTYDRMDRNINYDGQNFNNMYMTSLIQYLIDSGWRVKASLIENGWLEVDTADDLQCYEKMYEDGLLNSFCRL